MTNDGIVDENEDGDDDDDCRFSCRCSLFGVTLFMLLSSLPFLLLLFIAIVIIVIVQRDYVY